MTMLGRAGMLLSFTSGYYPLSRPRSANQVVFTDVTASARLLHATNICGSRDNKQFLLEEMGCGVALFDYDNDGWLDIFLVNGRGLGPVISKLHTRSFLFCDKREVMITYIAAVTRI